VVDWWEGINFGICPKFHEINMPQTRFFSTSNINFFAGLTHVGPHIIIFPSFPKSKPEGITHAHWTKLPETGAIPDAPQEILR
jgi:hypothetical protein